MTELSIEGFDALKKIGEGGMATVWKARQLSLDRTVAIKVLSAQFASDPADIERFQAEARAAARLKHPGIVQVYDARGQDNLYFFVMEYVAGYTVGDWVRRKGRLKERNAMLVALCVAEALDYAWRTARLIHCDIKPDNVMVDADGTVKVADLGLARTINAMAGAGGAEEVLGTPSYMSPEQATGAPDLDYRTDIYSLGAMLYHILSGKLLFEGQDEERVMEMQVGKRVPDIRDLNPAVSSGACALIERMLAKDRQLRQAHWSEVVVDIVRVQKGRPPAGGMLPEGASTMRRKHRLPRPDPVRRRTAIRKKLQTHSSGVGARVLGIFVVLWVIVAVILLMKAASRQQPARRPAPPVRGSGPAERSRVPADPSARAARELLHSAREWSKAHPGRYDEAIRRYRRVLTAGPKTTYAVEALKAMQRLSGDRTAKIHAVLGTLEADSRELIRRNRYLEAAGMYESYTGDGAEETRDERMARAAEIRQAHRGWLASGGGASENVVAGKLGGIVEGIMRGDWQAASAAAGAAISDPSLADRKADLEVLRDALVSAMSLNQRVVDSFKPQQGAEITVHLKGGEVRCVIEHVKAGRVYARTRASEAGGAGEPLVFGFNDLAVRETLFRMKPDESPEVALAKGAMALRARAFRHARRWFRHAPSAIRAQLLAAVDAAESREE
jgi:serine/threonine-protein kinase